MEGFHPPDGGSSGVKDCDWSEASGAGREGGKQIREEGEKEE